jgi:thiosulfate reductase cytochrome b subunit
VSDRDLVAEIQPQAAPPQAPKPEPTLYRGRTATQWLRLSLVGVGGLAAALLVIVLVTRWFLSLDFMRQFVVDYPGEYELPEWAPVGLPGWLGWQHFLNSFFMLLIIRTGIQVRSEKRPAAYWTARWAKDGKRRISLTLWLHQILDVLWLVNGLLFAVLLFTTGQWVRIVPTSWAVFPNAISAVLQYLSLDWPTENGWINYNSLQQLAYFTVVFVAAPLAALSGFRMSGAWPKRTGTLTRLFPVEAARAIHFPIMLFFCLFIVAHVALVLATGALRNLNHMYAAQDTISWTGFWIFVVSLAVMAAGWFAARPLLVAPIAGLFGKVSSR